MCVDVGISVAVKVCVGVATSAFVGLGVTEDVEVGVNEGEIAGDMVAGACRVLVITAAVGVAVGVGLGEVVSREHSANRRPAVRVTRPAARVTRIQNIVETSMREHINMRPNCFLSATPPWTRASH